MQITLDLPEGLAQKLQQLGDRLPEILDQALQDLTLDGNLLGQDERQIIDLLTRQSNPAEILAIRPSETLQARMSELLAKNKVGGLSRSDEAEFDRYMLLEHWVRMAKINARKHLKDAA
ncbi:MAG: hypothetical protein RLZZ511_900 [Cyanobacteriota bacterium]|jgi:hypothetical protein